MAGPTALLDASTLYPAALRDFLLRLADRYLFAPLWSADIHTEWMRSLLDPFVVDLFEASPDEVLATVRGHRAALRNPPRSASDHLAALERVGLVRTASLLRPYGDAF